MPYGSDDVVNVDVELPVIPKPATQSSHRKEASDAPGCFATSSIRHVANTASSKAKASQSDIDKFYGFDCHKVSTMPMQRWGSSRTPGRSVLKPASCGNITASRKSTVDLTGTKTLSEVDDSRNDQICTANARRDIRNLESQEFALPSQGEVNVEAVDIVRTRCDHKSSSESDDFVIESNATRTGVGIAKGRPETPMNNWRRHSCDSRIAQLALGQSKKRLLSTLENVEERNQLRQGDSTCGNEFKESLHAKTVTGLSETRLESRGTQVVRRMSDSKMSQPSTCVSLEHSGTRISCPGNSSTRDAVESIDVVDHACELREQGFSTNCIAPEKKYSRTWQTGLLQRGLSATIDKKELECSPSLRDEPRTESMSVRESAKRCYQDSFRKVTGTELAHPSRRDEYDDFSFQCDKYCSSAKKADGGEHGLDNYSMLHAVNRPSFQPIRDEDTDGQISRTSKQHEVGSVFNRRVPASSLGRVASGPRSENLEKILKKSGERQASIRDFPSSVKAKAGEQDRRSSDIGLSETSSKRELASVNAMLAGIQNSTTRFISSKVVEDLSAKVLSQTTNGVERKRGRDSHGVGGSSTFARISEKSENGFRDSHLNSPSVGSKRPRHYSSNLECRKDRRDRHISANSHVFALRDSSNPRLLRSSQLHVPRDGKATCSTDQSPPVVNVDGNDCQVRAKTAIENVGDDFMIEPHALISYNEQRVFSRIRHFAELENQLHVLNLGYCGLTCERLRECLHLVSRTTAISYLSLEFNLLTDLPAELLDSLGRDNLDSVTLQANLLHQVPNSIPTCRNLRYLNLSRNKLTSIPSAITELEFLECLELSHNDLQELPKSGMGSMRCLQILKLDHNELRSLPDDIGLCNDALVAVDLSGNEMFDNGLPENFRKLSGQLQELLMEDTKLMQLLPRKCSRMTASELSCLLAGANLDEIGNRLAAEKSKTQKNQVGDVHSKEGEVKKIQESSTNKTESSIASGGRPSVHRFVEILDVCSGEIESNDGLDDQQTVGICQEVDNDLIAFALRHDVISQAIEANSSPGAKE